LFDTGNNAEGLGNTPDSPDFSATAAPLRQSRLAEVDSAADLVKVGGLVLDLAARLGYPANVLIGPGRTVAGGNEPSWARFTSTSSVADLEAAHDALKALAEPAAPGDPERGSAPCTRCGAPMPPGRIYRCDPCVAAATAAVGVAS
jgi:hypothetical protein